jgi:hypothetical protein
MMTFKELMEALEELQNLGVDMDKPALVALHEGVTKVKTVFTNGRMDPYMDARK